MKQKVISHVALTRIGVRCFTSEVNDALTSGYTLKEVKIEKRGLRIVCFAVVEQNQAQHETS